MFHMSLLQSTPTWVIALVIFLLIILFFWFGFRARRTQIKRDPDHEKVDLKALNGMLLGFLGLLLAFTFGMSNSRFNNRRELVTQEANNIGTAIMRTDVYPDSIRQVLKANLKGYLEARIAFYKAGTDVEKTVFYFKLADSLGRVTWSTTTAYARGDDITTRTSQLIPALNAMIDVATTRRAAGEGTIPDSIMYFLFILCCCSAFLLGYDHTGKIDWIIVFGFAIMLSATVFNIIDLDRPRSGFINMDRPNQAIVDLRELFVEQ